MIQQYKLQTIPEPCRPSAFPSPHGSAAAVREESPCFLCSGILILSGHIVLEAWGSIIGGHMVLGAWHEGQAHFLGLGMVSEFTTECQAKSCRDPYN